MKKLQKLWVYLTVLSLLFPTQISQAASLTSLSDTMSRIKDSELSDHTIKSTTPTGAGDTTDTITIAFPAGFTIGSVNYTDIDLSHGASTGYETEEALAATADATSWGAAFSGQTLTLTHPTNAANGDIATSDKIVVEIGDNATGGSGNDQIQNQTVAQNNTDPKIVIDGTFGDDGTIAVEIVADDQVIISTTIDPYITFSISQNNITLTKSGGGNPDYSNTGFNNGSANTLSANTNAPSGYTVTYSGSTLTSGSNTIDAMSTKGSSSTGTEQFGINLRDNATPNTGTEPSGGSGTPTSDYNTVDEYRFVANTITSLASASVPSVTTTYTVTYIDNVSQITEAGAYSTTLTYLCTGNF